MATIELIMTVGSNRELRATVTTQRDKLDKLKPGQEVRVKIATGQRSLSSNALSHQWYKDAANQTGETIDGVRNFCKLRYGVPILRAESKKFRAIYDTNIKHKLTYEEKLDSMPIIDVTSLMNKGQMNQYLSDMQREYANRGVILETPKDAEYAKWIE